MPSFNWEEERKEETRKQWKRADKDDVLKDLSIKEARRANRLWEEPETSKILGSGHLGTLKDARKENMLDPNGLFLGVLEDAPIYYNGESHLINYGLTRSGKGTDIILPNLAHVFNRSIVVNDIKDGENCYASSDYRATRKNKVLCLNPHNLPTYGAKEVRINPFNKIIEHAQRKENINSDCLELAAAITPSTSGTNKWVAEGAQKIIATWLEWAAIYRPEFCTISELYKFIGKNFSDEMDIISNCGHDGLEMQADMIYRLTESPEQWTAYESELQGALWSFRPDTPLAKSMSKSNFNPASMVHELTTLYLMADSALLEASSRWLVLTLTAIANACAHEKGKYKTLFMIDELANLPYMAILPKALTLYAGKGVQLWGFCQGRNALLKKGYTKEDIANFESQSGVLHCWDIKESELIKDIELWSGKTTVTMKGRGQSGGTVGSASLSTSELSRSVLQTDDIMKIGEGQQLIRTNGANLYKAKRVHYWDVKNWKGRIKDVRKM